MAAAQGMQKNGVRTWRIGATSSCGHRMGWVACSASFEYPGDDEANMILAERSSIPVDVGCDAEEAGDDVEYVGEGVSGGELNEGGSVHWAVSAMASLTATG